MTALKAHEVGRFLLRPDVKEGVFLAYGPDTGLVRETAQRLAATLATGEAANLDRKQVMLNALLSIEAALP